MSDKVNQSFISIHHIGSRGGSRSFPINVNFESEILNVLYDADVKCLEQVEQRNQTLKSKLVIYPYCISKEKKSVDFYITYDPNLSSFYKPKSLDYDYYYSSHAGYDYYFNQASKIEKVVNMDTTTLDDLMSNNGDFVMPDFLSLDTQGSELDILEGSPNCVNNTLAILLETAFIEFYESQPCFDEVFKFMREKGFEFIKFTNIVKQNRYNFPIGLRSEGCITDADALFIRSPESLSETSRCDSLSYYKLAFIYVSFNMLEPALRCMEIIEKNGGRVNDTKYCKFINEVFESSKDYNIYPQKFSDVYSVRKSHMRYSVEYRNEGGFRSFLNRLGILTKIIKIARNTLLSIVKYIQFIFIKIKMIHELKKNKMEILLKKNGFIELSKTIYNNRIKFQKP